MAVFERDFYGLSKYGADVDVEFDVNPFDASPDGYGAIRVTWHSPSGDWQRQRLIRSRSGYAATETDGTIVLDTTNGVDNFADTNLAGGVYYYYTLFIQSDDVWNRAGATSSIVVKKPWTRPTGEVIDQRYEIENLPFGHADLMWERVPPYFRYIAPKNTAITDQYYFTPDRQAFLINPDDFDQENQHLRMMLDVLGFGLDWVHNYQESLLWANDPRQAHMQDVARLAGELGIDFEYGIPAPVMRSKVANAALLARRRGTVDGLQDVAALSTGWDVDISVSNNLFLNRDQSEFANPIFPEWDSATNYAVGQKVQFGGGIWTALVGAYGNAQKPPTLPTTSNTWWTITTDADVTTLVRSDTHGIVTWKGFVDGTTPQQLSLAVGVSDSISGTGQESNALAVRNGTGSHAYDILGASNLWGDSTVLPEPHYAIRQGVPVPRPSVWDPTVEYDHLGILVQHLGASWRSIGQSLNQEPKTGSIYWEKVGVDERPLLGYSFYAHGPLTGTAHSGGVAVTPGMAFFDEQGHLLVDQTSLTLMAEYVYDTFNHSFGTPDYAVSGSFGAWSTTGTWDTAVVDGGADPVAFPVNGTGTALQTVDVGLTQYRVAATFEKPALSGKTDGIAIRYVDASNYMMVTRTAVKKNTAGTLSTVATLSTAVQDGDRVQVKINDTSNTFTVYLNGVSVASGSLSGGTAPYKHGLMVV